jgi:hypothetical protein
VVGANSHCRSVFFTDFHERKKVNHEMRLSSAR